jgi:lysophospholipase L1-like esterase/ketosteroid isomerase-like protein
MLRRCPNVGRAFWYVLSVALLVVGVVRSHASDFEPRRGSAADEEAIVALIATYEEAFNSRNIDRLAALILPDASFVDALERECHGMAEIRAVLTRDFSANDNRVTVKFSTKAITPANNTCSVASGEFACFNTRGLVDLSGHFLAVVLRHEAGWAFSDLRLALNWRRPLDLSGTVPAEPPPAAPPASGFPDAMAAPAGVLEEILVRPEGIVDAAEKLVVSAHLVDADGKVITGSHRILSELINRRGSRRAIPQKAVDRGEIAIVDGVLHSPDNGLLGLPTVPFTAVLVKDENHWRYVAQFHRALFAQLFNVEFWTPTIESFEELDRRVPPPQGGIVFVGDSDVVRCEVDRWFPGLNVLNRGFGGSQIDQVVHFLPQVLLKHEPRLVVFSCGGNDIAAGKSPERVYGDLEQFIERVVRDLPKCRIIVTSQHTSPVFADVGDVDERLRRFNDLVRLKSEKDPRLLFLPETRRVLHDEKDHPVPELFGPDQLHFSDEGYRRWTAVISPHLKNDGRK